mgnify:FL=1
MSYEKDYNINHKDIDKLYGLLNEYNIGELDLFTLLDESLNYFYSIRGVCAWLTNEGKNNFDGYHFDDLVYYYNSEP